jgi:hypothetical protein
MVISYLIVMRVRALMMPQQVVLLVRPYGI